MINVIGIIAFSFFLPLFYHFRISLESKFRLFLRLEFENNKETPQFLPYAFNLMGFFDNEVSVYGNS